MAAPSERIVAPDQRKRPPVTAVERWGTGKGPVRPRGMGPPTDLIMKPEFQHATEPLLVPNVAAEHERRLVAADQRLYANGSVIGQQWILLFKSRDT